MNKDTFFKYIASPANIGKTDLSDLENLSEKFPWFFPAHQLQLFYHKTHNDIFFQDYLSKWSFYSPDREKLFIFLNQSTQITNVEPPIVQQKIVQQSPTEVIPLQDHTTNNALKIEEPVISTEVPSHEEVKEIQSLPLLQTEKQKQPEITPEKPTIPKTVTEIVISPPEPIIPLHEETIEIKTDIAETMPETPVQQEKVFEVQPESKIIEEPESIKEVIPAPVIEEKQEIHEKPEIMEVISSPEVPAILPVPEEKKPVITPPVYPQKDDTPKEEKEESLADKVLRRCEEIKKRRAEEAAQAKGITEPVVVAKESKMEVPVISTPPVIIEEEIIIEKERIEPEIFVEEVATPEITSQKEEPDTEEEQMQMKISSLLSDLEIPTRRNKKSSEDLTTEIIPDEFYKTPVYDISMLEKNMEENLPSDFTRSGTRTFCGWLTTIEKNEDKKTSLNSLPSKDNKMKLIDRFITEKPGLMVKPVPAQTEANKNPNEEETDICSETLAGILAMQKNYSKAISMYKKLSLLYPEKSIYFAGQIEKLTQEEGNS
ncbi:MAG: hypothetical protein CVU05_04055 [Bacteroidetes bacterium HGW-Bacteroidetes-21]|nr:MAG: hypothetical protein CVU05_04055 [Bacteroidetes bacterium HGW-Bacteroidetes-21]